MNVVDELRPNEKAALGVILFILLGTVLAVGTLWDRFSGKEERRWAQLPAVVETNSAYEVTCGAPESFSNMPFAAEKPSDPH